jgi:RNA polymerase sigma-70 factor, ECF subfamily
MDVDVTHGRRRVDRDHDLLDALRRGDPTAPDELVTRYRQRGLGLASGITGNHQDAEDVVQDAFWTVLRKIHAFHGEALGVTAELVKGRAHRARRFLRKRLA